MVNCGACGKFLSSLGAVTCSTCPLKYHRACRALTDKSQISREWVCPNCKKNIHKGDNSHTPVKGICDGSENTSPIIESGASASSAEDSTTGPYNSNSAGHESLASLIDFRNEFIVGLTEMPSRLGVVLEDRDVVFAERVGPRPMKVGGRPSRVAVRFAPRQLRDELLRAARVRA
ncbi:hypothetical protein ACJJTC_017320 [Scirpophaga incertulas]